MAVMCIACVDATGAAFLLSYENIVFMKWTAAIWGHKQPKLYTKSLFRGETESEHVCARVESVCQNVP